MDSSNVTTTDSIKKNSLDMTNGSIFKSILLFSIPLILGNLLQQLYNTADSLIVGNFVGKQALAAVGSSGMLIYLISCFFLGAASGAGIILSQLYGAKDYKRLDLCLKSTLAIGIIIGLITSIIGVISAKPLLVLINTSNDVLSNATIYLRLYFVGIIFNVIYNMAAGILNAFGDSKRSLLYLGIASVVNIILDFYFVAFLKLGIAGAAIATDISQFISSTLAIIYLARTHLPYHVDIRQARLYKDMSIKIIMVSLPTAIQNAVIALSNVLIQAGVNAYGTNATAGFAAYMKVDGFNILPILSISLAATTFIGQNIGAKKMDRVYKGIWIVLSIGLVYTAIISVIMLGFSREIIGLFSRDPEVINYGILSIRALAPFYMCLSICHSLAGSIRGTGNTLAPMVIMLLSLCLYRILWIIIIAPKIGSIWGVLLTYPTSFIVCAILMIGLTIYVFSHIKKEDN